jgi:hypothetical protein
LKPATDNEPVPPPYGVIILATIAAAFAVLLILARTPQKPVTSADIRASCASQFPSDQEAANNCALRQMTKELARRSGL